MSKAWRSLTEALLVGAGSALILLALLNLDYAQSTWSDRVRQSISWRRMVWLGDRSYSLYLVHFLFVVAFQVIHRDFVKWPEYMAEPLCVAFVLVSIAGACVTYRVIERPANKYGHELAQRVAGRV